MKTETWIRCLVVAVTCAVVLGHVQSGHAAAVAYWRFEDSPGYLQDSSGNGHTLTALGSVSQASIPGSGAGSDFLNPIPQTGASNEKLAVSSGGRFTAVDSPAFTSNTFTLEAFFNYDAIISSSQIIAGHFASSSPSNQRSYFMAIQGSGTSNAGKLALALSDNGQTGTGNTEVLFSDAALLPGKDYYAAVAVDVADTSSAGITMYLQNLTDNTALSIQGKPHSASVTSLHNSTALFAIGAQSGGGNHFLGSIDEVRLSNTVLAQSELLISASAAPVPEPSTLALAVLGLGCLVYRWRRGR